MDRKPSIVHNFFVLCKIRHKDSKFLCEKSDGFLFVGSYGIPFSRLFAIQYTDFLEYLQFNLAGLLAALPPQRSFVFVIDIDLIVFLTYLAGGMGLYNVGCIMQIPMVALCSGVAEMSVNLPQRRVTV